MGALRGHGVRLSLMRNTLIMTRIIGFSSLATLPSFGRAPGRPGGPGCPNLKAAIKDFQPCGPAPAEPALQPGAALQPRSPAARPGRSDASGDTENRSRNIRVDHRLLKKKSAMSCCAAEPAPQLNMLIPAADNTHTVVLEYGNYMN